MMQSSDRTNTEGSRQLRAVAGMLLALSGLSLAAMMASCSSPSTQGKSVSTLGELIQEESGQERSIHKKFAAHRSVIAQPQSGRQAHPSTRALVVRQAAPDCELAGLKPDTVDAGLWARLKLDYERHCYKQADALVRRRLRGLDAVQVTPTIEATTSGDRTRDKLEGAEALKPSEVAFTVSGAAVKDPARASAVLEPTSTSTIAEPSSPPLDAKFYRERAIAAYHDGDLALALVDFDLAIRLDPNFEDAYIDRGIILYRMREPDLAFDDVAQAMRIEHSHRIATPPLPKASPLLNKN
jgi:tetratricopeptide (TPR) repeat protein